MPKRVTPNTCSTGDTGVCVTLTTRNEGSYADLRDAAVTPRAAASNTYDKCKGWIISGVKPSRKTFLRHLGLLPDYISVQDSHPWGG